MHARFLHRLCACQEGTYNQRLGWGWLSVLRVRSERVSWRRLGVFDKAVFATIRAGGVIVTGVGGLVAGTASGWSEPFQSSTAIKDSDLLAKDVRVSAITEKLVTACTSWGEVVGFGSAPSSTWKDVVMFNRLVSLAVNALHVLSVALI